MATSGLAPAIPCPSCAGGPRSGSCTAGGSHEGRVEEDNPLAQCADISLGTALQIQRTQRDVDDGCPILLLQSSGNGIQKISPSLRHGLITSLHVIPEDLSYAGHTHPAGWAGGGCWAAAKDVSLGEVAAALLLACCLLSAHCLLSACCSSWCIFQLHMGKDGLRGRTKPPLDLFQHPHEAERTEQLLRSVAHQLPTILSSKPCWIPAQPPSDSSGPFHGISGFLSVGDNFQ